MNKLILFTLIVTVAQCIHTLPVHENEDDIYNHAIDVNELQEFPIDVTI